MTEEQQERLGFREWTSHYEKEQEADRIKANKLQEVVSNLSTNVGALTADLGDHTDAAGIVFVCRIIERSAALMVGQGMIHRVACCGWDAGDIARPRSQIRASQYSWRESLPASKWRSK